MSDEHRDYTGAKFGMWLFLFSEVILFGGLFVLYAVYLYRYPKDFAAGAGGLDMALGAANTAILLTGSLFAALSLTAVRRSAARLAQGLLWGAVATGVVFLINKAIEWSHEFDLGIYPGSPVLAEKAQGEIVFFGLYYVTLGLHGLHVLIGSILLGVIAVYMQRGRVNAEDFVLLENGALYWHLVDLIWIFIFPLYYLLL